MQFHGLQPFRERYPTIQVVASAQAFDLHNDADLRDITIDFQSGQLRLMWVVKTSAWKQPERPETVERKTSAGLVLVFSGVRSVSVLGALLTLHEAQERTVDFLEYSRLQQGLGRIRVVLESDAEIVIVASHCELLEMRNS